jgi:hypothetical protein
MKTNFGDLFIFKVHCKIAALTLSITLQMYKQLHIQKLNPPAIYIQLANAPDEIAISNFSEKILLYVSMLF